jgi:hypothetical protein
MLHVSFWGILGLSLWCKVHNCWWMFCNECLSALIVRNRGDVGFLKLLVGKLFVVPFKLMLYLWKNWTNNNDYSMDNDLIVVSNLNKMCRFLHEQSSWSWRGNPCSTERSLFKPAKAASTQKTNTVRVIIIILFTFIYLFIYLFIIWLFY